MRRRTKFKVLWILALLAFGWLAMIFMPGEDVKREFILDAREKTIRGLLFAYVSDIADTIGERHYLKKSRLDATERYIAKTFRQFGYTVHDDNFKARNLDFKNIWVEIKGNQRPDEIIVIGAHYDSAYGTAGADDNATGVAALLVLSQLFSKYPSPRTLRFVAFTNEELPFFETEEMGSFVHAKKARDNKEKIRLMFSLETIGFYNESKNSQKYPFLLNLFYPSVGNFIGFITRFEDRDLLKYIMSRFRTQTKILGEGAALPSWVPGISQSDHSSFWKNGYPAIMVTDTAPYRYPHYHGYGDTSDKIHFEFLTLVVTSLEMVLVDILHAPELPPNK